MAPRSGGCYPGIATRDVTLEAAIAGHLGQSVRRTRGQSGGDVADAYQVWLEDGSTVFAKTKANAAPGFFRTEAASLQWLKETAAVAVPEVLAVSDDPPLLILEWIDPGRPHPETETLFGTSLAALHLSGAPSFGRADHRTTGSRALPNEPTDTWAEFYASQRLTPLAVLAADEGALPSETIAKILAVAHRLGEYGATDEPPARLHGDLWAGNRLIGAGGISWLIDPASHGGHREFDLAMMRLFGGYEQDCFDAYNDAYPLSDGWQHRIPLHQLAPLIVHAIKFGGGYLQATQNAVAKL